QNVLQLVPEAVRTSGLIERRARPDAAGEGLIEKPAVEEEVQSGIGRLDLDRAEHLVPMFLDLAENGVAARRAIASDQGSRLLLPVPLSQPEHHLRAFPRLELEIRPESGAGVHACAGLPR